MTSGRTFLHALLVSLLVLPALVAAAPAVSAEPLQPEAQESGARQPEPRIAGGTLVPQGDLEFMTRVRTRGVGSCSGFLVDVEYVMTAEHCVTDAVAGDVTVVVGRADISDLSVGYTPTVLEIHIHPELDAFSSANDMAMLRITPVPEVEPIGLVDLDDYDLWTPGTLTTIAGWGGTNDPPPPGPPIPSGPYLRRAQVPVISDADCKDMFNGQLNRVDAIVCAGATGTGTCPGDSGGPLFTQNAAGDYLAFGVTSGSAGGCGVIGNPGFFSEIVAMREFTRSLLDPPTVDVEVDSRCQSAAGQSNGLIRLTVQNPTDTPATVAVLLQGLPRRDLEIPANSQTVTGFSGRPDGVYTVQVDGDAAINRRVPIDCDPDLEWTIRCAAGDGVLDVSYRNDHLDAVLVQLSVETAVGSWPIEYPVVETNETGRRTYRDLPDGPITMITDVGSLGGVPSDELLTYTDVVACNPVEARVTLTCLGDNGLVRVAIDNRLVTGATYAVTVGDLAPRRVTVAAGSTAGVGISGRPDGELLVSVSRGDQTVLTESLTVSCDPQPSAEVSIAVSCLSGNGRLDVTLANPTASIATYAVTVGALAPRSVIVGGDGVGRETITGRPDGVLDVVVTRDGAGVESTAVTIACD